MNPKEIKQKFDEFEMRLYPGFLKVLKEIADETAIEIINSLEPTELFRIHDERIKMATKPEKHQTFCDYWDKKLAEKLNLSQREVNKLRLAITKLNQSLSNVTQNTEFSVSIIGELKICGDLMENKKAEVDIKIFYKNAIKKLGTVIFLYNEYDLPTSPGFTTYRELQMFFKPFAIPISKNYDKYVIMGDYFINDNDFNYFDSYKYGSELENIIIQDFDKLS